MDQFERDILVVVFITLTSIPKQHASWYVIVGLPGTTTICLQYTDLLQGGLFDKLVRRFTDRNISSSGSDHCWAVTVVYDHLQGCMYVFYLAESI